MTDKLLDIFREKGAYLDGHFGLTSGKHSPIYLQCALVLQHPPIARELGGELAKLAGEGIDLVVSPAVGGIVIGQEVAFHLNARAIFTERVDGKMSLRRGFAIRPGEKVLAVEDVVTTAGRLPIWQWMGEGTLLPPLQLSTGMPTNLSIPPTNHTTPC